MMNTPTLKETMVTPKSSAKVFTYEEALSQAQAYFGGDQLAAGVWLGKYALKDSDGRIYESSPDEMHKRMAAEIARVELKYPDPVSQKEIFQAFKDFRYIVPQGSPMAGIGNSFQIASLSNCFVIGESGNADSYGAIMKMDEELVQLMKRRGGVGLDLSHIRPKGSPVKNSAISSTGIVSFMERYSNSTREVAQGGRRGALMLSISVEHPDAEDFIDAKLDGTKISGANVSVKVNDDFMRAALAGETYVQRFPVGSKNPAVTKEIDAATLWKKIVHNAWKSAEPGVLFWDTILRESIPDCYADLGFRTVSTNPCGEIPLCPYDSCRLLAINLYSFVEEPFTPNAKFNFDKFREYVILAQRIADDIIDLELEKIDAILKKIDSDPESDEVKRTERNLWLKIREKCIDGRRTGTGVTGEGDMLAALGIRYGSDESIDFSEKVHRALALAAYASSVELAEKRGAFPLWDAEREAENPFVNRLRDADPELFGRMIRHGRRNIALLTIAPTGTTSLMTQTTSGIEPVFMVSYKRRKKVNPNDANVRVDFTDEVGDHWQEFQVFHHHFATWLKNNGYDPDQVADYPKDKLSEIIAASPYQKATAQDVDWINKVNLQGRIQKWVDHSISVTVNVPENVSEELIGKIYQTGHESGCKGITVYREGSRSGVLVSEKKTEEVKSIEYSKPPKRPTRLKADVVRFNNEDQKWIAVIGLLHGKPYEIFTGKAEDSFRLPEYITTGTVIKFKENGKSRYDFQYRDKDGYRTTIEGLSRSFDPEFWNYAKLISGVLRHGMPLPFVVHMVSNLHLNDESLNTWKNGVRRALSRYITSGTKPVDSECPECGTDALVYEEGCINCKGCGYTKCT